MDLRMARSLLFAGALLSSVVSAGATTPAERLLAQARSASPPPLTPVFRDASALLSDLNVPGWMRHDYSLGVWETSVVSAGSRVHELQFQIAVVNGSVIVERARHAIVIASGDVTIESGSTLLVVAGGNIRFAHDPAMDWSGVFVARGRMTAPWVANAVVHAAAGLHLSDSAASSVNLIAVDTPVDTAATAQITHRSSEGVFSDSTPPGAPPTGPRPAPATPYAGKRCANGPPLREVARHVPRIARERAKCEGPVTLLVASCVRSDPTSSEELWTVHLCTNVLAEVTARYRGGRSEFAYYERYPSAPAGSSTPVPNAPTPYGGMAIEPPKPR